MFRVPTLGLALALATAAPLGLIVTATPAAAQQLSQGVGKPLEEAVNLAKKRQGAAAAAKIQQARAAAKTAFEQQKVSQTAAYVFTATGQYAAAAKELEGIGAPAKQVAPLYYSAGQFAKAAQVAAKAGNDPEMQTIVAQSYVKLNQPEKAAAAYKKIIATSGASKKALEGLASAQFKMGDKQGYLDSINKLIKLDPSPRNWKALLTNLKNERMPGGARLGLFMLISETGNLDSPAEFDEFVQLAATNGAPTLGLQAMKAGIAKGALPNDARTQRTLAGVQNLANKNVANVAKLAASKNPADLINAGKIYLGLGQYDVAAATFGKAGNNPEALLLKGISQVRAGQAAAAKSTFATVKGEGYGDIASLWSLYSGVKKSA